MSASPSFPTAGSPTPASTIQSRTGNGPATGAVALNCGARPASWADVLVVMESSVERVEVAPRSGFVILILKGGRAVSLHPDVVRRLSKRSVAKALSWWQTIHSYVNGGK